MLTRALSLLQPAPYANPISDTKTIQQNYRYWRVRLVSSLYAGYVVFYLTRKSFTFAMPFMSQELGFSKAQLGLLATVLYISYGLSKFLSGVMSDRSNPRYFMATGLFLTGVFNILFGCSSSLWMLALFWGLNGWFQAWGWPAVAKSLTHWFNKKQRGFWWSVCTTSHNVGGALIPLLSVYFAQAYGWRYALYVPGVISLLFAFILINRLRDIPPSLGLPPVENIDQDEIKPLDENRNPSLDRLSARQILFEQILNNPWVWILALSYFFIYAMRMGINDWSPYFFIEAKQHNPMLASSSVLWYETGGFLGVLAAGWCTDRFFGGNRLPYILICVCTTGVLLSQLWLSQTSMIWVDLILMAGLGFFIYGPHLLIGLAAAEFVHKNAAGTANGFAGLFGYFGAAASGLPLGFMMDKFSWHGFFASMMACAVINFVMVLFVHIGRQRRYGRELGNMQQVA